MAKTKAKNEPTVEVLPPEQSKQALEVINEGTGLVSFIQGLVPFFLQAASLEANAAFILESAKALVQPTTKAQDAELQDFIRRARAQRQAVEAHWEITSIISRFHKKLTAKRSVATDALKDAEQRATSLHTRYVEDEQRRARLEQQRLQREADERAEADRREKLAEFEAAALKAEESSPTLSDRELIFRDHYLATFSAVAAATRAGYKNPVEQAARLLASDKIRAAIKAAQDAKSLRTQIEVMKELPAAGDDVEVKPELNKGDRWRWSATCVDLETFREAAFRDPNSGIPLDIFVVDQTRLNEYARALESKIELWPGIVAHKKNTVV